MRRNIDAAITNDVARTIIFNTAMTEMNMLDPGLKQVLFRRTESADRFYSIPTDSASSDRRRHGN